jgi:hypothetical protein
MSDSRKPSDAQYSFDLRSRVIARSDPHSTAVRRVRSSDRLLLIAQNSIEEEFDDNSMASAPPERQVQVFTGAEVNIAHDATAEDLTAILHNKIQRLQSKLRHVQDENREISDKNRQLAASKKIPDSIVAPKLFLGNTKEQDPADWLSWFGNFVSMNE